MERIGAVESMTPTPKISVVVLAALMTLVAVQVTVVVPSAKRLSERGVQTGVRALESVSVAVTLNATYAPAELVASAVMSEVSEMTGLSAKTGDAKRIMPATNPKSVF